jgi:hypothetical protein
MNMKTPTAAAAATELDDIAICYVVLVTDETTRTRRRIHPTYYYTSHGPVHFEAYYISTSAV